MKIKKYNESISKETRLNLYDIFNNFNLKFGKIMLSEVYNSIFDIELRVKIIDNVSHVNYKDFIELYEFFNKYYIIFNIKNNTLYCYFVDIEKFLKKIKSEKKAKKYNIL